MSFSRTAMYTVQQDHVQKAVKLR